MKPTERMRSKRMFAVLLSMSITILSFSATIVTGSQAAEKVVEINVYPNGDFPFKKEVLTDKLKIVINNDAKDMEGKLNSKQNVIIVCTIAELAKIKLGKSQIIGILSAENLDNPKTYRLLVVGGEQMKSPITVQTFLKTLYDETESLKAKDSSSIFFTTRMNYEILQLNEKGRNNKLIEELKSAGIDKKTILADIENILLDSPITASEINLALPKAGNSPQKTVSSPQYDGMVRWIPNDNPFGYWKSYKAEITLTPKAGWSLAGMKADFSVFGSEKVTRDGAVITVIFPPTPPRQLPKDIEIYFDDESSVIKDSEIPKINQAAGYITANEYGIKSVKVDGYIYNVNNVTSNNEHDSRLSEKRANAVTKLLEGMGISITPEGHGIEQPFSGDEERNRCAIIRFQR